VWMVINELAKVNSNPARIVLSLSLSLSPSPTLTDKYSMVTTRVKPKKGDDKSKSQWHITESGSIFRAMSIRPSNVKKKSSNHKRVGLQKLRTGSLRVDEEEAEMEDEMYHAQSTRGEN
jgi:hypothetical protein